MIQTVNTSLANVQTLVSFVWKYRRRKVAPSALFEALAISLAILAVAAPAQAQQSIDGGRTETVPGDTLPNPWNIGSATDLYVGNTGSGTLNIGASGAVSNRSGYIGRESGSTGLVAVSGANAAWTNSSILYIGNSGTGTLSISDSGAVSAGVSYVGRNSGSRGTATVSGPNSRWTNSGSLYVGDRGAGSLDILDGGAVTSNLGGVGSYSTGTVNVEGIGSNWTLSTSGLYIGIYNGGTGTLNITNGGTVSTTSSTTVLDIGSEPGSTGTVNVAGAGSTLNITGTGASVIGREGTGSLSITNGGAVSANSNTVIALTSGSTGMVRVDGVGSRWTISGGNLTVGSQGTGSLTISNGGLVTATVSTQFGSVSGTGTLHIGAAQGDAATAPGTLNTPTVTLYPQSSLVFHHTSANYAFNPQIAGSSMGPGTVKQIAGTTILTGNSPAFSGVTSVTGGALLVNGRLGSASSAVAVSSGATLGGNGRIGGDVAIADGGILMPGATAGEVGTLIIDGDLALGNTSILDYHFGEANAIGGLLNDLTVVNGNLTLDGVLNITASAGGSFDPGVYRIFSYGGTLTDNGLSLGTMPPGNFSVDTSTAGQVNLIVKGPLVGNTTAIPALPLPLLLALVATVGLLGHRHLRRRA